MNYLQQIQIWFNHLNTQRKISLIASAALIIMFSLSLGYWLLAPKYDVLFSHLDSQDANTIIKQLEERHIPYQLDQQGTEILIAEDMIDKTRLNIMGSDMNLSGSVGFELFDKNDFGMTDFSQKINYQRAIQGELERTISSLEEVSHARVHIVTPEHHLFDESELPPKASITLHLKSKLTPKQVHSIQQLVTSSVAGLSPKHVVVLDQNGNTLTSLEEDPINTQFNRKKHLEQYLNEKVLQILRQVFKDNQVMVKVDATINYDELQRERIQPQSQGIITHEKEIKHNIIDKNKKASANQDTTLERSYQLGTEKVQYKKANGTIERLSISVVVPEDTDAKTIHQITRLVQSVVGFDASRGDKITVEALISKPARAINTATHASTGQANSSYFMPILIALILGAGTPALLLIRQSQKRKRESLLIELTQWLAQHES